MINQWSLVVTADSMAWQWQHTAFTRTCEGEVVRRVLSLSLSLSSGIGNVLPLKSRGSTPDEYTGWAKLRRRQLIGLSE